jgi:hypothetical protein
MPVHTNQFRSRPSRRTCNKLDDQSPLDAVSKAAFTTTCNHLTNKPYLAYLGQPLYFLPEPGCFGSNGSDWRSLFAASCEDKRRWFNLKQSGFRVHRG